MNNKIWSFNTVLLFSVIQFVVIFMIIGCGIYSFTGSSLPRHIKTVAIPLFDNTTAQYGVSQPLTDGIIDALTQDNTLKIASPNNTDSILNGSILSIKEQAGQYDRNEQASDFRVHITVKIIFEDRVKRENLWEETWTEWGEYESDMDEGIRQAAEKLSEKILNRMVSGW
ncbi:MAG: LptE family protein [bacterium]